MDDESRTRDNWMALAACILTKKAPDKCIKAMGINIEQNEYGHAWDEKTVNEAVKLRNSGMPWKEVFRKLGVEAYGDSLKDKVYKHKDYGVSAYRKTFDWTEDDMKKIGKLREQGGTWSAIGREFGCSAPTVKKVYGRWTGEVEDSKHLKWDREFFDEVTELKDEGYSFAEIGKMYGRTKQGMATGYARAKRKYEELEDK